MTAMSSKTIEILQSVLATEIVCVLRYTMHAIAATGISSEGVKAEFAEHAKDEQEHAMEVAERINQLGGKPNFNPEGLASRSASQYGKAENLVDMIRENLIAERIAVEHYRELIRYFGDEDPTTRVMIEAFSRSRKSTPTTCTICWSRTKAGRCCRASRGSSRAVAEEPGMRAGGGLSQLLSPTAGGSLAGKDSSSASSSRSLSCCFRAFSSCGCFAR